MPDPVVIKFIDPSRKRKKTELDENKTDEESAHARTSSSSRLAIDMKRARFDVKKLGISGFEKSKKLQQEIQLAISLGAHKPKNKHFNVKEAKKIAEEKKRSLEERKKNEPKLEKMPKLKGVQKKDKIAKKKKQTKRKHGKPQKGGYTIQ